MTQPAYKPYVPDQTDMKEFTFKAIFLGAVMSIVLGAANAYLGLKAGMTVAATFPAAVAAMAILRFFKGNILEENMARTTAGVGEALAAGAIFTIPAFLIVEFDGVKLWDSINYYKAVSVTLVGGILGVLLVALIRRTLVNDKDLLFPESVACAEIVKAGQKGATGAAYVFGAMGLAAMVEFFKNERGIQLFTDTARWIQRLVTTKLKVGNAVADNTNYDVAYTLQTPNASPAFMGVGYIIGPKLAALNFSGGVLAWWVLVPAFIFFNPQLVAQVGGDPSTITTDGWWSLSDMVWRRMVRPMAVGTMLVGAFFTLFRMRDALIGGIKRSIADMKAAASGGSTTVRTDQDLNLKKIIIAIAVLFFAMIGVYKLYCGNMTASIVAAIVMLGAGVLFSAVAGYLVGIIGSSSNPISGLTLSTLIIAAVLMVLLGISGKEGVAAVLGVAAVICCVAGIAGDMVQDLKVGHLLGGTPRKMELGGLIGVVAAALVIPVVINVLHQAYTLGSPALSAPQAGLMATMSKAIVTREMAWPLIVFGMMLGVVLILLGAKSLMIIAVGMYLPFGTTGAIFVGGMIKGIVDLIVEKRKFNDDQKKKVENSGTLLASGLVAGEALIGVIIALVVILRDKIPAFNNVVQGLFKTHYDGYWPALLVFGLIALILIYYPVRDALKKN